MAGQVVQMDYAVIGDVSTGFGTAGNSLRIISKVLTVAIGILRAAAFFSAGTTAALAQYLEGIQKACENLAKICDEFSGDLKAAINDHKKGDFQGKRYFGEGIR